MSHKLHTSTDNGFDIVVMDMHDHRGFVIIPTIDGKRRGDALFIPIQFIKDNRWQAYDVVPEASDVAGAIAKGHLDVRTQFMQTAVGLTVDGQTLVISKGTWEGIKKVFDDVQSGRITDFRPYGDTPTDHVTPPTA